MVLTSVNLPGGLGTSGSAWGAQLSQRCEQMGRWGWEHLQSRACWRVYTAFVCPIKTNAVREKMTVLIKPAQKKSRLGEGKNTLHLLF